jgi:carbamoyltransferase
MMIEINWRPSTRELRFFSGGLILLALVATTLGHYWWNWVAPWPMVVLSIASVILFLSILWPRALRPIYLVWMIAVFPIGWLVSHVVLAAVYFGVFTPIGLLLRMTGYDPLGEKAQADDSSYWVKRPPPPASEQYFKQY